MEFITFDELVAILRRSDHTKKNVAAINELILAKMGVGYTRTTGTLVCHSICERQESDDTHKAYVFLEPIEEEKPECVCERIKPFLKALDKVSPDGSFWGCVMDECPNCGKDLK